MDICLELPDWLKSVHLQIDDIYAYLVILHFCPLFVTVAMFSLLERYLKMSMVFMEKV